jgi:hypothetical protein
MPFLVPAVAFIASNIVPIAAAASAVSSGVGLVKSLTAGGPEGPSVPTTTTPSAAPQSATTNQAQKAAVSQALPNLQALTGGSLSPEYAALWGGQQTGLNNNPQAAGNIQEAINNYFGLGATGNTGVSKGGENIAGGPGILDILSKVPTMPHAPSAGGGIAQDILNSDFHGLV